MKFTILDCFIYLKKLEISKKRLHYLNHFRPKFFYWVYDAFVYIWITPLTDFYVWSWKQKVFKVIITHLIIVVMTKLNGFRACCIIFKFLTIKPFCLYLVNIYFHLCSTEYCCSWIRPWYYAVSSFRHQIGTMKQYIVTNI